MRGVLALLWLCACNLNEAGNHFATSRRVSHPAMRGSPVEALRDSCGDGDAMAKSITRRPYLQKVTTSSAKIGWVSSTRDAATVHVTRPDGSAVASVLASSRTNLAGSQQAWASITGLSPSTVYCYAITDGERTLVARTGFRTAPDATDPAPIRFLAFGDSGGGGRDQHVLRDRMLEVSYDLVVHTGDLAYNAGRIEEVERTVFGVYHDLFRNLPFFPAAGNHDYRSDDAAPFREVFALPGNDADLWYSYDWGRIHFAALDTEADYPTQARWLDEDLGASTAPWKIVYLHRPPYSSGKHGSDTGLRRVLEPVLEKHHVQLVLAGHDHDYERIAPHRGTHHVVTGGGGVGTRRVGRSSFTEVADNVIHFVTVDVSADQLVLHAIDASGSEFDSVVIPRV